MRYLVYNSLSPIGEKISKEGYLGVLYSRKSFPDGEFYVRIENVDEIKENSKVFILVQEEAWPKFNPNRIFIESILLTKRIGEITEKIYLILPYFPYSRQDKEFLRGEAKSFEYALEVFKYLGIRGIITVTLHAYRDREELKFKDLRSYMGTMAARAEIQRHIMI